MLLTMPRIVRSEKNVSHVLKFECMALALRFKGAADVHSSVCRFDVDGYIIRLTWDEGAGAAIYVQRETYGMVRYLKDDWDVDEVTPWVEKVMRIIEHMEGS